MQDKYALHDAICAELNTIYVAKNHDYGDSFGKSYAEYGMVMAFTGIRLFHH